MNDSKEGSFPTIKVPLARPDIGEAEAQAAYRIVKSGWLIFGPETTAFEREFAAKIGVKHAIAVNSGTAALLVSQAAAGLGAGDEVIVPDMTFVSTATASMYLGVTPVFGDITMDDYGLDPAGIEALITPKTKAIIPVHYAGQSCRIEEIVRIARKHKLLVIEDAAESHLAKHAGRNTGAWGDLAIFSFTPSKPMTTGEGGMIVTDSDELAAKCRLIKNFGDTDKFQWDILGFNYRMPEVMGAVGRIQLQKLPAAVERRREIARRFIDAFSKVPGLVCPFVRDWADHNFQLFTLRVDSRVLSCSGKDIIGDLIAAGVSSRLYYPALHRQKVFSAIPPRGGKFPNAVEYERTSFSIPLYPNLTEDEIRVVIDVVTRVIVARRGAGIDV
jgi:dTDP-4-amino-4,6-dideoxygalactose transaminase